MGIARQIHRQRVAASDELTEEENAVLANVYRAPSKLVITIPQEHLVPDSSQYAPRDGGIRRLLRTYWVGAGHWRYGMTDDIPVQGARS